MTDKYTKQEQPISVHQLVCELMKHNLTQPPDTDYLTYGYRAGWLEEQDVTGKADSVKRKNAARIIHAFMQHELHEPDIPSGNAAVKLQDLYDCRVCVRHVIQVYEKGIMDAQVTSDGRLIFGMNQCISIQEMNVIVDRLFNRRLRNLQTTTSDGLSEPASITTDDALHYYRTDRNALMIDVRSPAEFTTAHLKNAINIPLISILKNPYAVSERRDRMLLLYCSDGYQSDMAAQCLKDAGYEKVYGFAWKADSDKK